MIKKPEQRWGANFWEKPYVDLRQSFPKKAKGGSWEVSKFTLSAHTVKMEQLQGMMHRRPFETRYLEPNFVYLRLWHPAHGIVMSTTPMELMTNRDAVEQARGNVLLAGLGLGVVLMAILRKPEVMSVTVVEKDADLITLMKKYLPLDGKVSVVQADIFAWRPPKGTKYDVLYFDIWDDVSGDNLPEMAKLHQRFKGCKSPGAWMGSWRRDYLVAERRAEQRGSGW